jgi:hypothetical protein
MIQFTKEQNRWQTMHKPSNRLNHEWGLLSRQPSPRYTLPSVYMLKSNWDAALDCKNMMLGLDVVVRDHAGVVQAALSTTVQYITDPTVAEALVAWKAVRFCCDLGLPRVLFKGDSMQVISTLNKNTHCWSNFGTRIEDSKVLLHSFESFVVRHTLGLPIKLPID